VLTAGAALLSDFDEPNSTIARSAGFLTRGFAHTVRFAAGGHRHGTHSLLGAAVLTALAAAGAASSASVPGRLVLALFLALMAASALRVTRVMRGHLPDAAGIGIGLGLCFAWPAGLVLVPPCVALGVLAHIAGDMATHGGCPLLWPFSGRDFHDTPVAFTTGKFFESVIVTPALTLALAAALAWDTGIVGYLAVHTSGHLAR
jgi:membrane-bound metal-dependent hydrolase YbcI (DUF457 family)